MPSTYSPNLAIELIGTGDQAGTWGNTTNTNLGTLIEQAISGYVTQAVATGTDTTITIPNGSTGVARNMFIELTGTGGSNTNLIVPANKKLYFIYNNTASGQVTVKVSGQTGVSVANKDKVILVSDGTDVVEATTYVDSSSATISNAFIENCYVNTPSNFVVSGNFFSRSTTSGTAAGFKQELSNIDTVAFFWNNATSGDTNFVAFGTETTYTARGRIDYLRGSGTVALVNVSDRRAKTVYGPYTTSGQEIDSIPIYTGKMNYGTIERPLLIADELQQVAPYAVTGEPNAVNPDGSPNYQGVDYAVLVPLLIAEVQSLRSRVAALEAK